MNVTFKKISFMAMTLIALNACTKKEELTDDESSTAPEDSAALKANYCLSGFVGLSTANGSYELNISHIGPTPLSMTGQFENNLLSLTGERDGYTFNFLANVVLGGTYMAATTFVMDQGLPRIGVKMMGVEGVCPTTDINQLPKIAVNPVNLEDIQQISRFRSSSGHNYSDVAESCRSMKHYFQPKVATEQTTEVFAPITGIVVAVYNDDGPIGDDEVHNQHITIQSIDNPAIEVDIFHTELSAPLVMGTLVEAGTMLGWADLNRNGQIGSDFDIAVHVNTADGKRNVSLFDIMTDEAFADYSAWSGLASRSDFQISKEDRDNNPLQCESSLFIHSGQFIDQDDDALLSDRWVQGL